MKETEVQDMVKAQLTDYLVEHGMRCTPERYALLRAIYERNEPFTADDLFHQMEERFRVSLPTVYNSLELFVRIGLVVRHTFGVVVSYEKCFGQRDYFHQVCIKCGKVQKVKAPQVSEALNSVHYSRMHVQNVTICAFGICSQCRSFMTKAHNKYLKAKAAKDMELVHKRERKQTIIKKTEAAGQDSGRKHKHQSDDYEN